MLTFLIGLFLLLFILCLLLENKYNKYLSLGFIILSIFFIPKFITKLPKIIELNSIILFCVGLIIIVKHSLSLFKNKILSIILFSLKIVHERLIKLINTDTIFFYCAGKFNYYQKKNYLNFLIFFFDFLPKITLLTCCFIDIIIMHKFNYFYSALWLILVPIIFQILIYTLNYWASDNIDIIKDFVKIHIDKIDWDGHIIIGTQFDYELKRELQDGYTLEMLDKIYTTCFQMLSNITKLNEILYESNYKYFQKVISLGYIITWGYLIIFTIIKFIN